MPSLMCGKWDPKVLIVANQVDWFNNRRLLEPIGHVPPAEFEAEYYRQQSGLAIAA